MEAVVEGSLEAANYLVDNHFESGWDNYRKYVNGKKVEDKRTTVDAAQHKDQQRQQSDGSAAHATQKSTGPRSRTSATAAAPRSAAKPTSQDFRGGAALTGAAALANPPAFSTYSGASRRQRNQLPSPDRDADFHRQSIRECQISDQVLREYEEELDDPKRHPESVLSSRDLRKLRSEPRRDSAMASGYNDSYTQSRYDERPRSQPPRSSRNDYYDDGDSDYDERSGKHYRNARGRGYDDDRDYDRIIEETERYRGPVSAGPLVPVERRESYRSGYDGAYGEGTVTRYGRRTEGAVERREDSYVSRRSKSRGREDRDRSSSRSRSRSREGIRGKLDDVFDTSARGLGVGLAGAVVGGLAGRQFGQKHRDRDIVLGALIGGLGLNAAENKWREWKDDKERDLRRDEERIEQRFDGRSRSNVR